MPNIDVKKWPEFIRQRYENYLKTSFYFSEPQLRASFEEALRKEGELLKGPIPEIHSGFAKGVEARKLAIECFPDEATSLCPALLDGKLYTHQEQAIRVTHLNNRNVVVATGTASGKTESFLYPILFELYRQHLEGLLSATGVRALILYPMNALANDQRQRLGAICKDLLEASFGFNFTFGQYIGQTPENSNDSRRNAAERRENRLPGELVFRDEMRQNPPHILLTNYSMLEYLLIRPDDSPLFDYGRGKSWQFIVLDEAHQYRGTKGIEMGMLIRRLKQRLHDGGQQSQLRCIATSATISSGESEKDKRLIAKFAQELFGECFCSSDIIFGNSQPGDDNRSPRRYHAFLRALEGAFLVHRNGRDTIVLNRKTECEMDFTSEPLEIALCRECGQHYYVGQEQNGKLRESERDPSHPNFGVDYYLPVDFGDYFLCRICGTLSKSTTACDCAANIRVKKCKSDDNFPDRLKKCETCGYQRGGIGDPVQEIVHGSDGPNSVIVTALHELLPDDSRKILAFTDNRQEAAFFAWYAEDSYEKLRDRNLLLRAIKLEHVAEEGLSMDDLRNRLLSQWERADLLGEASTREQKTRCVLTSILREAVTEEKRLSLTGVGLVKWFVTLPRNFKLPETLLQPPWNFNEHQARDLISYLLDEMRLRRALELPKGAGTPQWDDIASWPQQAFTLASRNNRKNILRWGNPQSAIVKHFLYRLLADTALSDDEKQSASTKLMIDVWCGLQDVDPESVLSPGQVNGTYRLDSRWLRIKPANPHEIWECDTCSTLSNYNIKGICPRNLCPGTLLESNLERLEANHYRVLYESPDLPPALCAEEHTAQIDAEEARRRQDKFKEGDIHLLSSSTTFEVGVDLGDLQSVFLRNVPPASFNYTQRAGRAGRRGTPGLVLTYCRRNPHDLYHYEDPDKRVINGTINPPRLHITNEKIVLRHMAAVALSAFFKENKGRFKRVENFIHDWDLPQATDDLRNFCEVNRELKRSQRHVVPDHMHNRVGLTDDTWITNITGAGSRLAQAQMEVCADYTEMNAYREEKFKSSSKHREVYLAGIRMNTIAKESTINYLSRKAVIPKYGFPVDVIELEVRSNDKRAKGVALQRNLSQAIAEYAPGGKVIANKWEWESCGVKVVSGKTWPVYHYHYDDVRNFKQSAENFGISESYGAQKKYLIPEFGFVTPLFKAPSKPQSRTRRLYTTRPFFRGFTAKPQTKDIQGVLVTKAEHGVLVILCEGKNREGFYICRSCGTHMVDPTANHKKPSGSACEGTLERFSLGHELATDVVRLQFPGLHGEWDAYSVAYAVLLGAADTLEVPDTDLNVTITGSNHPDESAIVLYDNVPGGAGLVAQFEDEEILGEVLRAARERVQGNCGCDSSCYGCLRNYRNQFAHANLNWNRAKDILSFGMD